MRWFIGVGETIFPYFRGEVIESCNDSCVRFNNFSHGVGEWRMFSLASVI